MRLQAFVVSFRTAAMALQSFTHCAVRHQLCHKSLSMLQDTVGRCTSKERSNVGIVSESQDARSLKCLWKHLFISKPKDFGLLCRPCLECMPIQSMDSDDA
jgi:hypothetical protein